MVPAVVSVDEGDGMVQVCAELNAMEATQREFSVTLVTSDDSGMNIYDQQNIFYPSLNICSSKWNRLHCHFVISNFC